MMPNVELLLLYLYLAGMVQEYSATLLRGRMANQWKLYAFWPYYTLRDAGYYIRRWWDDR